MQATFHKIIDSFETRKPWAVFWLTLLQGPFVGYIYCNKGLYAVLYFLVRSVYYNRHIFLEFFYGAPTHSNLLSSASIHAMVQNYNTYEIAIPFVVRVVVALHCYVIAKMDKIDHPLKWYARDYAVVIFVIIVNVLPNIDDYIIFILTVI